MRSWQSRNSIRRRPPDEQVSWPCPVHGRWRSANPRYFAWPAVNAHMANRAGYACSANHPCAFTGGHRFRGWQMAGLWAPGGGPVDRFNQPTERTCPKNGNARYPSHLARLVAARLRRAKGRTGRQTSLFCGCWKRSTSPASRRTKWRPCLCTVNFVDPAGRSGCDLSRAGGGLGVENDSFPPAHPSHGSLADRTCRSRRSNRFVTGRISQ